ncbi:hypothetical protein [Bacillus thuringiensis]|uniref:hypothetical protein n=2 Tax=Bacillus TaxID=1386 RepID=UPI0011288CCF|nr:hypothetical protein [Bacillus thuringiensis]
MMEGGDKMVKLETLVQQFLDNVVEQEKQVTNLQQTRDNLVVRQIEKIEEVALKLLPVIQTIKNMGYKFHVEGIDYMSKRGPILGYNSFEGELYVFDAESKCPCVINVHDNSVNNYSYSELLKQFDFPHVMNNLISILNYYQRIQREYQGIIDRFESELNEYQNL